MIYDSTSPSHHVTNPRVRDLGRTDQFRTETKNDRDIGPVEETENHRVDFYLCYEEIGQ